MIFIKLSKDGTELNDYALDKEEITIGNDSRNDVCLNAPDVAYMHAKIRFSNLELHDMSGKLGTIVNGHPVNSAILDNGDVISIGSFDLRFFHSKPTADGSSCDTKTWKLTTKVQPQSTPSEPEPTWKIPKTIKI